jgi:hypothetical protein
LSAFALSSVVDFTEDSILGNEESKPVPFRELTAAEFARLSSSRQLTLLAIRRAQLSSRKALLAAAEGKRRRTKS